MTDYSSCSIWQQSKLVPSRSILHNIYSASIHIDKIWLKGSANEEKSLAGNPVFFLDQVIQSRDILVSMTGFH